MNTNSKEIAKIFLKTINGQSRDSAYSSSSQRGAMVGKTVKGGVIGGVAGAAIGGIIGASAKSIALREIKKIKKRAKEVGYISPQDQSAYKHHMSTLKTSNSKNALKGALGLGTIGATLGGTASYLYNRPNSSKKPKDSTNSHIPSHSLVGAGTGVILGALAGRNQKEKSKKKLQKYIDISKTRKLTPSENRIAQALYNKASNSNTKNMVQSGIVGGGLGLATGAAVGHRRDKRK
jgi:gas vesicle protein